MAPAPRHACGVSAPQCQREGSAPGGLTRARNGRLRQTLTLADARVGVHTPATTRTLGVDVAADLCAAVGLWATETSSIVRRAAGALTHSLVSTELLRSSGAREGDAAGGAEARGRSEEHAVVTALGIGLTGVARCFPNPAGCRAHALAALDGAAVLRVE